MENPELLLGVPVLVIGVVGVIFTLVAVVSSVGLPGWLLEPVGGPEALAAAQARAAEQAEHSTPHAVAGAIGHHEGAHPGVWEYIQIGIALAIVTTIEVAIYYIEALEGSLIAILLVLSALKFGLVVMWFMHLRYDSRTFSQLFVAGLMLAAAVFIVVLATLGSSLV